MQPLTPESDTKMGGDERGVVEVPVMSEWDVRGQRRCDGATSELSRLTNDGAAESELSAITILCEIQDQKLTSGTSLCCPACLSSSTRRSHRKPRARRWGS